MEKVVNFIKNYVLFIVIPIMIIELFVSKIKEGQGSIQENLDSIFWIPK